MIDGHPSHAIGILTNKWVESKQIPMKKKNWLLPLMSKLLRVQEALRSGEPRHSEAGLDRTAPILTEIRGIGIDLITTIWASPDNY